VVSVKLPGLNIPFVIFYESSKSNVVILISVPQKTTVLYGRIRLRSGICRIS
jgi:hypothetical protein